MFNQKVPNAIANNNSKVESCIRTGPLLSFLF